MTIFILSILLIVVWFLGGVVVVGGLIHQQKKDISTFVKVVFFIAWPLITFWCHCCVLRDSVTDRQARELSAFADKMSRPPPPEPPPPRCK